MTLVYTFGSGECEQLGTYHYSILAQTHMFLATFELKLRQMKAMGLTHLFQLLICLIFRKMV